MLLHGEVLYLHVYQNKSQLLMLTIANQKKLKESERGGNNTPEFVLEDMCYKTFFLPDSAHSKLYVNHYYTYLFIYLFIKIYYI